MEQLSVFGHILFPGIRVPIPYTQNSAVLYAPSTGLVMMVACSLQLDVHMDG